MNGGCYGSVLLDEGLRLSLVSMNGHDVAWIHGCVLDHGHDGEHGAPVLHVDGEPQQWLRWHDAGAVRVERVDLQPPGRHSRPITAVPESAPPQSTAPVASAYASRAGNMPEEGSQTEALWAIAAAIDRLADAIARWGNPPQERRSD